MAALMILMSALPSCSFSNCDILGSSSYALVSQRTCGSEIVSNARQNDVSDEALSEKFSLLRSIGVDYGLVRTGIAITTGGYRPRPLNIISGLDSAELSKVVVDHVLTERATNVVLGLPLHKNGTVSEQSVVTRTFGQELMREMRCRCGSNIDLVLWDERYTSKEAASRITAQAMARNQRIPSASDLGGELDADAACIILEDYYKEFGADAERVALENATLADECNEIYRMNIDAGERTRMEKMEERERLRNARREMMERVRALEEESGTAVAAGKRKKKKKKKKR
eukprot:CAMPEP_0181131678 /NCGR_PEP_ID=MMETSP1071-20121207/30571_1 /TAXON_ID=35127 /ORGANISM="Thalassiosira sp., Strain NH16" /LENGTH=285 /DNA_ID=CAMNT_0023217923 /DNA_START=10 /DNA_END=867 /DNA_ORIENTATION=-